MKHLFAVVATLSVVGLAGCTVAPPSSVETVPTFYQRLDQGAALDEAAALDMINAYRAKSGLAPLALDAELVAQARRRASGVAETDTSTWGETPTISAQKAGLGANRAERVSAGYRTLAEAFSGWRDSPPHNRVLLAPAGRRFGIAAVDRPGAKYRVYWDIIVEGGR
ncbi:hypothetical protein GCM10007036_45710 [Alsobacter metallidurans]|uniref:SCP domain-containing protein n=1 Tax=Alsobacter metallidurans TaxID=340221 RepID=A0A917MKJ4_9HYPH|nr:CAP domain-containing protein [Alsobacter metallidurans]GGH33247.1 hypothetical protein GCM10007036_45710 [Alsobacter metallidurans]